MPYRHVPVAVAKAELFKALGHPLRVLVLEQLTQGELTVGELADRLEVEMAQLSQQLAVLRRAQVVVASRAGSAVRYSLRDPRTSQLLAVARQLLVTELTTTHELLADLIGDASALGADPAR
ncbi:ArsR/SmtB family transcription factor [Geodermatophilus sp. CPCC 206100]|uniref:ArsR/SmtB family transcription factor n=1 Tax=Geodermatophilus sp. CPCC 206100 TaxID=3020054 RepID=UPI003B001B06